MKFYSYDYIKNLTQLTDWVQFSIIFGLLLLVGTTMWLYYHRRKDSKYREIAIIGVLFILILLGIRLNEAETKQLIDTQHLAAQSIIEQIAAQLKIEPSRIYLNTDAAKDGAIIKIDDRYYRTIIGTDGHYLLESMQLHQPQIELVEVNQ